MHSKSSSLGEWHGSMVTATEHDPGIRDAFADRVCPWCPFPSAPPGHLRKSHPNSQLPIGCSRGCTSPQHPLPMGPVSPPSHPQPRDRVPKPSLLGRALTSGFQRAWRWTAGTGTVYHCIFPVALGALSSLWLAWLREADTHH